MSITVNGRSVTPAMMRHEMALVRDAAAEALRALPPSERDRVVADWAQQNLVDRMLLEDAAARFAGHAGPAATSDRDALLHHLTSSVPPPASERIEQRYRAGRDRFMRPEQVHAAHIVRHAETDEEVERVRPAMAAAARRLAAGEAFEVVAADVSDCPDRGGDLGLFGRGVMVEPFEAVVFALRPGETSGVFRTGFGLHLATVRARVSAGVRPFAEVRNDIAAALWQEDRDAAVERFLDELRRVAVIEEQS